MNENLATWVADFRYGATNLLQQALFRGFKFTMAWCPSPPPTRTLVVLCAMGRCLSCMSEELVKGAKASHQDVWESRIRRCVQTEFYVYGRTVGYSLRFPIVDRCRSSVLYTVRFHTIGIEVQTLQHLLQQWAASSTTGSFGELSRFCSIAFLCPVAA